MGMSRIVSEDRRRIRAGRRVSGWQHTLSLGPLLLLLLAAG